MALPLSLIVTVIGRFLLMPLVRKLRIRTALFLLMALLLLGSFVPFGLLRFV